MKNRKKNLIDHWQSIGVEPLQIGYAELILYFSYANYALLRMALLIGHAGFGFAVEKKMLIRSLAIHWSRCGCCLYYADRIRRINLGHSYFF